MSEHPEPLKVELPTAKASSQSEDVPSWFSLLIIMFIVGFVFSAGVFIGSYHQEIVQFLLQAWFCFLRIFTVFLGLVAFAAGIQAFRR